MAGSTSSWVKKASGAAVKGTAVYHGGAGGAAGLGGAGALGGMFAAKLATGVSAALPGSPSSVAPVGVAPITATVALRP